MPLTINVAHDDCDDADAGAHLNGAAQRRLVDELLDELTSLKPRDRTRMFHAWHQGGLSIVQLSAVNLLAAEGPLSMGRLADLLGISVASATGIVGRMEERGLVERRHDATDRRVVMVHQAAGSSDLFQSLEQQRREHLSVLLDQLTEQELTGFLTGLRAMRAARERAAEAGR
jgi:DNA-binding MarR family transcriptional regulator